MINKLKIEQFYDYFDDVANILYESKNLPYIEGMIFAFNRLLGIDNDLEVDIELDEQINKLVDVIQEIEINAEEIRKSVQLGLLKGFKHTLESNSVMTPDTIGIFIAYLVEKLYKDMPLKTIFDPLLGTSNLVITIANQLKNSLTVYGVDNDTLKCELSKSFMELVDFDNEVFFQDTFTFRNFLFDLIVTDMPVETGIDKLGYFPYKVINHHLENLNEGGYFIALIENDFFEKDGNEIFKKEIDDKAYIFGLIKLSETMFKSNEKSILILRKKGVNIEKENKFLLVDLPSFNDKDNLNKTIINIDNWFTNREAE